MKFTIIFLFSIILFGCNNTTSSNNKQTESTEKKEVKQVAKKNEEPKEWGNTHCPVMEDKVEEDGGQMVYQGKIVRFCCKKCIKKFKNNPEKYHDMLVEYSSGKKNKKATPNGHAKHDHSKHDH